MGTNYTQTDTAATHETQACATDVLLTTPGKCEIANGGTAGTTEQDVTVAKNKTRSAVLMETPAINKTSWAAGTYTCRLNVTTASPANLTVVEVYVCRVNSSGTNQETVGSLTGLTESLQSTGVKTFAVTGSAQTAAATDRVYVVFVVRNGSIINNRTFGFTPDQDIDTPIVGDVTITPSPVALSLNVVDPTVPIGGTSKPLPVARWDVVPFQSFAALFNVGVIGFSKDTSDVDRNGMKHVKITVTPDSGTYQSVSSKTFTIAPADRLPTINSRTGYPEYWIELDETDFSVQGPITISMEAENQDGGRLVANGQPGTEDIRLYVDKGTAPGVDRYADSVSGNDTTGDGSVGNPFATLKKAVQDAYTDNSSNLGGCNIILEDGTYTLDQGGDATLYTCDDQWCTIKLSGTATKGNVHFTASETALRITKLKFDGVKFDGEDELRPASDSGVWVANCDITLGDQWKNIAGIRIDWMGTGASDMWFTDCVADLIPRPFGATGVDIIRMVRSCTATNIGEDVHYGCPFVLGTSIDGLSCGAQAWHTDCYQLAAPRPWRNVIVYGLKAINVGYDQTASVAGAATAGFIVGGGSATEKAVGLAIVNCYIEANAAADYFSFTTGGLGFNTESLILWNNTFRNSHAGQIQWWQQTDVAANSGAASKCSGRTVADTPGTAELQRYGERNILGSSAQSVTVRASATEAAIMFELPAIDIRTSFGKTWHDGDWTIPINITTANSNLTIKEVYLCRLNHAGVDQGVVASDTGLSIGLGSAGVKTITLAQGGVDVGAVDDRPYIIIVIENTLGAGQTCQYTPDQVIKPPVISGAGKFAINGDDYDVTIEHGSVVGNNFAAGDGFVLYGNNHGYGTAEFDVTFSSTFFDRNNFWNERAGAVPENGTQIGTNQLGENPFFPTVDGAPGSGTGLNGHLPNLLTIEDRAGATRTVNDDVGAFLAGPHAGLIRPTPVVLTLVLPPIALTGQVAIAGSASLVAVAGLDLLGVAALVSSATLAVAAELDLAGAVELVTSGSVAIATELDLAGVTSIAGSASLALDTEVDLAGAAVLTGITALTTIAGVDIPGAAGLSGSATMDASAGLDLPGVAALVAAGSMSVVTELDLAGVAALAATATSATDSDVDRNADVSFSVTGTLDAVGTVVAASGDVFGAAVLESSATLAAVTEIDVAGAATLSGTATLAVTAGLDLPGVVGLTGVATVTTIAGVDIPGAAGLSGSATLAATAGLDLPGVAALTVAGAMSVVAELDLDGGLALAGVVTLDITAELDLVGVATLAGDATLGTTAELDLVGVVVLAGVVTLTAAAESGVTILDYERSMRGVNRGVLIGVV